MRTQIKSLNQIVIITAAPLALIVACAGSGDMKNPNINSDKMTMTPVDKEIKTTQLNIVERSTDKQITLEIPTVENDSARLADVSGAQHEISHSSPEVSASSNEQTIVDTGTESRAATPTQHIMYFPSDIAKVDTQDYAALKRHAEFLLENPNVILNINGHADSQGSEKHNMSLSEKRANEVSKILHQFGVPDAQIIQAAHGETVPVVDVDDWVANRRVELEYANPVTVSTR